MYNYCALLAFLILLKIGDVGDNVRQEFENLEWRSRDEPGTENVTVDI